jgi:ribonuclease HI
MAADYRIISDGGSRRNGSADAQAYGSFQLEARDGRKTITRLEFGQGVTNNRAEYLAMLAGLIELKDRITKVGLQTERFSVVCYTDSRLVVDHLTGRAKLKAEHLKSAHAAISGMLGQFKAAEVRWTDRRNIVEVLGH